MKRTDTKAREWRKICWVAALKCKLQCNGNKLEEGHWKNGDIKHHFGTCSANVIGGQLYTTILLFGGS